MIRYVGGILTPAVESSKNLNNPAIVAGGGASFFLREDICEYTPFYSTTS
jgi:hypothetical protein